MQAFQHAYELGTNCLEMDVCMTKDKKIIVLHDSHLMRTCGIDANVKDYNYNELPKFLERIRLDFAPNQYITTSTCKTPNIPLFQEVLKKFPNVFINVEIKTPEREVIKAVSDLIVKYNRQRTTIWGAEFQQDNSKLQQINPQILRCFSAEKVLSTYLLYITGLLPFFDIVDDSLQVPFYSDDYYNWMMSYSSSHMQRYFEALFHNFIWFMGLIQKLLFTHLSKRGVIIYCWVLNTEKDFDNAIADGCHGIITDSPSLLKKCLVRQKLYQRP